MFIERRVRENGTVKEVLLSGAQAGLYYTVINFRDWLRFADFGQKD
jgi:hypothetical protein